MKITIEVRDDWLADVREAVGDSGSNDDEHNLLVELADEVSAWSRGVGDDKPTPDVLPPTFSFVAESTHFSHRAVTNGAHANVLIESHSRETVIDLAWRCAEAWS